MHSANTPYRNDILYPPFCKTFRRIQLVVCVVCFIVAVALLVIVSSFTVGCIILAATCFAFLLITLVDFLGSLRNVQYPTVIWLGIAILGAVMFFVSAGLMVFGISFMCIIAAVLSVLTGCVYLAEAVYILWRFKKARSNMVASSTKSKSSIAETEVKELKTPPDELSGTQSSFLTLGTQKSRPPAHRNTEIMTYGGTFHMSKDYLPLPSPVTQQGSDRRSMTQVDDFGCQVKHEQRHSQDMYTQDRTTQDKITQDIITQDKITQDRITQDDTSQYCAMPNMMMYEQSNRRLSSVARLRPEDQVTPFVEHHYNQTPCACGYTHYQASTIVKGAIRQHPQDTIQDHQQQIEHQMQQTRMTCRSQNRPYNEYDIQSFSRAPDSKRSSRTKISGCEMRRKESDTLRFCVPNPENVNIKMKPFPCSKKQQNHTCKSKPCEDKSSIPRRIPAAKRETIKTRDKDQITDQSVIDADCRCDLEPAVHSDEAVPEKQDEYKCQTIEEKERTPPDKVVHRCVSGCPCGSPVEDAKLQSSSCSPPVKSEKSRCSNAVTVRQPRFSQDSQGTCREDQKSLSKRCMVLEKTSRSNDSTTCHSKFPTVVQGTTKKYGCTLLSEKPYHPDSPVGNQMRITPKSQGTTQTHCLSKTNEASQASIAQRKCIPDPGEVVIEVSELEDPPSP